MRTSLLATRRSTLYDLAMDMLGRWQREKAGETGVGRVLSSDYCFFRGEGRHNCFQVEYEGDPTWDWRLESPYKEAA